MKRPMARPRSVLLAVALTAVAALCTVSTANAASSASETAVPAAPSNLTAKAVSTTSVQLTWTNNATDQSGVVISRNGVESVDVQGATVSSYTWTGLSPGTKYWFYIASKIYGTPGDPTGSGNTQSAWVGPVYVTTLDVGSSPPHPPLAVPNTNWAGYSAHPQHGNVSYVLARWRVPKVSCDAPHLPYKAAVAVWVGLWGRSVDPKTTWLPQAGTYSQCAEAFGLTATVYEAVVQLFHAGAHGFTVLMDVHAGDSIYAQVEYSGDSGGRLKFWYDVTDTTNGGQKHGYLYTTKGVRVDPVNATYQGGAIIERAVKGDGFFSVSGGLPKFNPISVSELSVGQDPPTNSSWSVYRWEMLSSFKHGHALAATGPLNRGSFAVTWKTWG
jgi:Peptidase A4 family/Fibronectin type III domain